MQILLGLYQFLVLRKIIYKVCILFTPRLVETQYPLKERLNETIQYN